MATEPEYPYCTVLGHKMGDHDQACVPAAVPGNPELRLFRAIMGLCPDCNRTEEHEHPDGYDPDPDHPGFRRDGYKIERNTE